MTEAAAESSQVYTSCDELLQNSELVDIRFYELKSNRRDAAQKSTWGLNVLTQADDLEFLVRCKAEVDSDDAEFVVDAAAVFALSEAKGIPEPLMREFSERVGVMALFPYLRSAVFNLAAQLGVERPVLPLLRHGELQLSAPDED
ncbi:hypothetical protein JTZ10_10990 [Gordonia rubripertincta]|uniref:Preprotein translocase subunit SecB n=1 Tax=Gordonia rubripertincta TaxID=36822 RepID=A0AAW4G4D5_GORRU|nr:hypothetical protein [Gordonia rubripertincta]MBM7278288.1 hypothetical protein [Gordonia rubripertincta]